MHNYKYFLQLKKKLFVPFLKKMAKTLFLAYLGPFLKFFGQNDENYVENKKIRLVIFLALDVPYFLQSFRKIV